VRRRLLGIGSGWTRERDRLLVAALVLLGSHPAQAKKPEPPGEWEITIPLCDTDVETQIPLDVIYRVDALTDVHLDQLYLDRADIVIRPGVGDVHWNDLDRIGMLTEA
jgi:hypothetical protein